MIVVRLTADGELDPTFSGDGIANGLGWSERERLYNAWSVAALDGGGLSLDTPAYPVRLRDDGELDWSFVSDVFGSPNSRPGADGQARRRAAGCRTRIARASRRLNPDGALDPAFGAREFALGEIVVDGAGERRRDAGRVGRRWRPDGAPPARRRRDPAGARGAAGLLAHDRRRRATTGSRWCRSRSISRRRGRRTSRSGSPRRHGAGGARTTALAARRGDHPGGPDARDGAGDVLGDTADEGDESTPPHRDRGHAEPARAGLQRNVAGDDHG